MSSAKLNEYATASHALAYLARADRVPHRAEGEAVIRELGAGDGRLLALIRLDRPEAQGVALDFSPPMLAAARERFAQHPAVSIVEHNLADPLPDLGSFDVVVSGFAIHHLSDERKFSRFHRGHRFSIFYLRNLRHLWIISKEE